MFHGTTVCQWKGTLLQTLLFGCCKLRYAASGTRACRWHFRSQWGVIREAFVLFDQELVKHEEGVVVTEFGTSKGSTDTGTDSCGLFSGVEWLCDGVGKGCWYSSYVVLLFLLLRNMEREKNVSPSVHTLKIPLSIIFCFLSTSIIHLHHKYSHANQGTCATRTVSSSQFIVVLCKQLTALTWTTCKKTIRTKKKKNEEGG